MTGQRCEVTSFMAPRSALPAEPEGRGAIEHLVGDDDTYLRQLLQLAVPLPDHGLEVPPFLRRVGAPRAVAAARQLRLEVADRLPSRRVRRGGVAGPVAGIERAELAG